MIQETTRNIIWQDMLDVNRLVRYYEAISNRYHRNYLTTRFVLLFGATGGFISLLDLIPENYRGAVQAAASVIIAVTIVWDFLADHGKKAAVLEQISVECSKLQADWKELWNLIETYAIEDEEAQKINSQLNQQLSAVTGRAEAASVRVNRKLNEKCTDDAYQVVAERYAR